MLPGFVPLLVFIIIDEIWGTRVGLVAAIVIGCLEMGWIGLKERRFDRFVLADTSLLVVLGGLSLLLHNALFFKLKPGLVELILCGVLALSAFSRVNVIATMSQHYMKGVKLTTDQLDRMKHGVKLMFWVFLVHTVLIFYSAFFWSDEVWAFISGGLFYILVGIVFGVEWWHQRREQQKLDTEEQLPVVDEQGKVIGKAARSVCHNGSKLLHPVVHLHVKNKNRAIYLQKRPAFKQIQPGKWDSSVGGHIAFGEDVLTALKREAYEEIGLKDFHAVLVRSYIWESEVERELVYVFQTSDYKSISSHSEEVEEGRFWTTDQIKRHLGKNVFTPNFEHEFRQILS